MYFSENFLVNFKTSVSSRKLGWKAFPLSFPWYLGMGKEGFVHLFNHFCLNYAVWNFLSISIRLPCYIVKYSLGLWQTLIHTGLLKPVKKLEVIFCVPDHSVLPSLFLLQGPLGRLELCQHTIVEPSSFGAGKDETVWYRIEAWLSLTCPPLQILKQIFLRAGVQAKWSQGSTVWPGL